MQLHHNENGQGVHLGEAYRSGNITQNEYALPIVHSRGMCFYSIFSSVHIFAMDFGIRKRVSVDPQAPGFQHKPNIFNEKERAKGESRVAAQQLRIIIKEAVGETAETPGD